jgi:hypothetical protein
MGTKTIQDIYQLKTEKESHKSIAELLSLSEGYINSVICSEKYKQYSILQSEELELRQKSSPTERTRFLVDELLESLEQEMKEAKTAKDKLKLIDGVKQLVAIVGIDQDDSQGINVVEVPEMMSKEAFNRAGAKTTGPASPISSGLEQLPRVELEAVSISEDEKVCTGELDTATPNTQSPIESLINHEVYETPTPTHISENDPWTDLKVAGID